jgi:hypothetical protein
MSYIAIFSENFLLNIVSFWEQFFYSYMNTNKVSLYNMYWLAFCWIKQELYRKTFAN